MAESGQYRCQFDRRNPDIQQGRWALRLRKLDDYLDRPVMAGRLRSPMAGSEHPGRKIRIWLTDRFGEMRLAGMGTLLPVSFLGTCHSDMQTE